MNFMTINDRCTGEENKNKGEEHLELFNVTTVAICGSNAFSAELFWFDFPSIYHVFAYV